MNYFEHHIGDYDEATAHLTACEDGIYSRLLRKYYATEKPLERDTNKLKRLVRARNREEKIAVDTVLAEFFSLADDGWHQEKCDEVIAAYQAGEPEREVKKANEDNRLKRHREERAKLFKILTDAGEHAPWNIPIADLREMAKRIQEAVALGAAKGGIGRVSATPPPPFPATAPATPATATQTPLTTPHSPDTSTHKKEIQVSQSSKTAELDLLGAEHGSSPDPTPRLAGPDSCGGVLRDVDSQVLADFKALRKLQKAPITETALAGLVREAGKARMTLTEVMRTCCENSWRGFKAEWLLNAQRRGGQAGAGQAAGARRNPHVGTDQRNYDEDFDGKTIA